MPFLYFIFLGGLMAWFQTVHNNTRFTFKVYNVTISLFKGKKKNPEKPRAHGFKITGIGDAGVGLQKGNTYINISDEGESRFENILGFTNVTVDFVKKQEYIYFSELDISIVKTVS
jgi:hypothetical protein